MISVICSPDSLIDKDNEILNSTWIKLIWRLVAKNYSQELTEERDIKVVMEQNILITTFPSYFKIYLFIHPIYTLLFLKKEKIQKTK